MKDEWHATFWGTDGKVSVSNSVRSSFSAQITLSCHTSVSEIHLASASAASNQGLLSWYEHVRTQVVLSEHIWHLEVGSPGLMWQSWVTEDVIFLFSAKSSFSKMRYGFQMATMILWFCSHFKQKEDMGVSKRKQKGAVPIQ